MSLKVARKEVVDMFVKLGRKGAGDWDTDKLKKRIKNIKSDMKDVEIPPELSTADSILTKILTAQEKGEKVVVQGDGEAETVTKSGAVDKRKNKGKDKGKDKDKGKEKKEKTKKFSRIAASVQVIKGLKSKGSTKDDMADAANGVYAKSGGDANEKEAKWAMNIACQVMEAWGVIETEGQQVRPVQKESSKA